MSWRYRMTIDQEYIDNVAFEKLVQPQMDEWYSRYGWAADRSGADWRSDLIISGHGGRRIVVEEKYSRSASGNITSNFLVEILQDIHTGELGWYYHVQADIVASIYCSSHIVKKYYPAVIKLVWWPEFKVWYEDEWLRKLANKYDSTRIVTSGRGITLVDLVPYYLIPDKLLAN